MKGRQEPLVVSPDGKHSRHLRSAMLSLVILSLVALSWQRVPYWTEYIQGPVSQPLQHENDSRFALHPEDEPWNQIEPSKSLVYHDCFDGHQCARLLLPLDWSRDGSSQLEIAVAVIRRPAKVNVIDPRYGGAVIFNPGGPAASGVQFFLQSSERLQNVVDADTHPKSNFGQTLSGAQYFDIISFDPRGVNHTVPVLNCFPTSFHRLVWSLGSDAEGVMGSSDTAFDEKWARYLSRSATCMSRIEEEGHESIAYYMGTKSVADDIVAITEQHGQWRETEARRLLKQHATTLTTPEHQSVLAKTEWRRGNEEVLFWGTSYGTTIGYTLAAMYPNRVSRIILDSVLAPQHFFHASAGDSFIYADRVFGQFVHLCHKHGPDKCKFYRESEEAISADMDALISHLRFAPLAVPASWNRGPDSITMTDTRRLIWRSLYHPHDSFPKLAQILQDVFNGNGSSFADYKATSKSLTVADVEEGMYNLSPQCQRDGPYSPACGRPNEWLEESFLGISCGDGGMNGDMTKEQFKSYWQSLRKDSVVIADFMADMDLMCVGWNAKTKWKYDGPFSGKTAHPMLLAGNRLDPVCPIENAYQLASDFYGSVVLELDTIGHGILSSKSNCAETVIRAYFQGEELPSSRISCPVEQYPFE